MKIVQATNDNLTELMSFYSVMCDVLGEKSFLPNGDKGVFPSQAMVEESIKDRCQFIGIEDNKIVAAYILNHDCDSAYNTVRWQINAAKNEVVIMHALRVLPDYGGRGYSKQLVEHAIQTARSRGWKAIRLDCLKGNDIPVKMYQSYGFKYVDTVDITYVDIGIPMPFHLYELVLG